jgi:hypothetical protein
LWELCRGTPDPFDSNLLEQEPEIERYIYGYFGIAKVRDYVRTGLIKHCAAGNLLSPRQIRYLTFPDLAKLKYEDTDRLLPIDPDYISTYYGARYLSKIDFGIVGTRGAIQWSKYVTLLPALRSLICENRDLLHSDKFDEYADFTDYDFSVAGLLDSDLVIDPEELSDMMAELDYGPIKRFIDYTIERC